MSVSVLVEVQIASEAMSVPMESEIRLWLQHAVSAASDGDTAEYEVVVRVVDEQEGRELNRQFREQDKATNVLSFPSGVDLATRSNAGPRLLGDVVICGPVVEREAAEQGKDPLNHWRHMLVHGALHLLGYDHQTEAEAAQMEALERDVLASRGIADPYTVA